ncbi:hypothetical protein CARUB_v10028446mg [Capsella rubella]|uniref:Uncharacterized protein n=2 Tax=Capsella rubella TaxID=81985 RepID=R0GEE4_9BRAS|nr:hypothetical protein CARUB_v10028446mg [Capsella rubella]
MNNPSPLLGFSIDHRLKEEEQDTKDLTINVETEIHKEHEFGPIKSSFSFSPHKFFEEDEPWKKQELYFFLLGVGIEEDDARFMMINMTLYVLRCMDDGLRGVLTLLLNVQFPSIEPIHSEP